MTADTTNTDALELIIGNYRYSSWSMRGWLAAQHAGLDIAVNRIALFTDAGMAELRAKVPSGLVPALLHTHSGATHVISDSAAITDYLARLAPDVAWWPEDLAAYGHARSIAAEMHSGFMALRQACPMNLGLTHSGLTVTDPLQADIDKVARRWSHARTQFGEKTDKPYLYGDWSGADIMFAPVVTRFKTYGIQLDDRLNAYMQAVLDHPHMRQWYDLAGREAEVINKYDYAVSDDKILGAGL